jgi:hypothetical protein
MQSQKGQSGNPAGPTAQVAQQDHRPYAKPARGEAEAIARKAIEMVKEGDMAAIRVCMDRLVPARRSAAIACELPPLKTRGDAVSAMAAIIAAVAFGDVTPAEATSLARAIDRYMFARPLAEYEERQAGPPASNDCQARLRSL